jgi:ActR/RegA family two-component response regulator
VQGGAVDVTTKSRKAAQPKILVVDDNEQVRTSVEKVSGVNNLKITTAASVGEALNLIHAEPFDVLLSDLRMTEECDGFATVSAMHTSNPNALTVVYTGYHELRHALSEILLESHEGLWEPMDIPTLPEPIHERLERCETRLAANIERAAVVLERDTSATIIDWLDRVERDGELTRVSLSKEDRTEYLPKLIRELAHRLRAPRNLGARAPSEAAIQHGRVRHSQGYSIPMMVEESRILQVCIFETLNNSLSPEDFRLLLLDAKTITDECDSQLRRTVASFTRQAAKVAA